MNGEPTPARPRRSRPVAAVVSFLLCVVYVDVITSMAGCGSSDTANPRVTKDAGGDGSRKDSSTPPNGGTSKDSGGKPDAQGSKPDAQGGKPDAGKDAGPGETGKDAEPPDASADGEAPDAALPDAMEPPVDAAVPPVDAMVPPVDAMVPPVDAMVPPPDA